MVPREPAERRSGAHGVGCVICERVLTDRIEGVGIDEGRTEVFDGFTARVLY